MTGAAHDALLFVTVALFYAAGMLHGYLKWGTKCR